MSIDSPLIDGRSMPPRRETVLWTRSDGVRCLLVPYDESRYQLRLVRALGTIKTDLFVGYASAVAASHRWSEDFDATLHAGAWPTYREALATPPSDGGSEMRDQPLVAEPRRGHGGEPL